MISPFSRFSLVCFILAVCFASFALVSQETPRPDDDNAEPTPDTTVDPDFDIEFDMADDMSATNVSTAPTDVSTTVSATENDPNRVPYASTDIVIDIDSFDFSTTSIQPKENPIGYYDVADDNNLSGTSIALADTRVGLSTTGIDVALSGTLVGSLSNSGAFVSLTPYYDEPGYVKPTMFRMRMPLCLGILSNTMRVSDDTHTSSGDSLNAGDLGLPSVNAIFSPELTMTWDRRLTFRLSSFIALGASGDGSFSNETTIGSADIPAGSSFDSELDYYSFGLDARWRVFRHSKGYVETGLGFYSIAATETVTASGLPIENAVSASIIPALNVFGKLFFDSPYGPLTAHANMTLAVATGAYFDIELGLGYKIKNAHLIDLSYRLHYLSFDDKDDSGDADVKLNVLFTGPQVGYTYLF
ncbi:MAG: hypothetical protein ABIH86_05490 [Planctomycetota bacterium]